jgi:hypothetical protein
MFAFPHSDRFFTNFVFCSLFFILCCILRMVIVLERLEKSTAALVEQKGGVPNAVVETIKKKRGWLDSTVSWRSGGCVGLDEESASHTSA